MAEHPGVYLDHNATSPVRPEARDAVVHGLETVGNPSSVHGFGRAARRLVEDAREAVAALIGCAPAEVVFTSGATEANNLALKCCGRKRVLVTGVEHDSVLRPAETLGAEIIPVNGEGLVDLAALERMLASSDEPALVAVMLANNETGVLQPVKEVARIAHARGALFLCDAVQGPGKIAVDMAAIGADMLSLSAHKLAGPQGTGCLAVASHVDLRPLVAGGGQERGRRGGTENAPGIAGFGAAAKIAAKLGHVETIAGLRDRLEREALARVPEARIFGAGVPRVPNTTCLALEGRPAETQVIALDLASFAVSAGAACTAGKVTTSHVLRAMGLPPEWAGSAIRISLGWTTRAEDIDRFLDAWTALARGEAPVPSAA
jgi:cysteine desulfurase